MYCFCFFFLKIRRPPRSTLDRSSAASDVYKRQLRRFVAIEGETARLRRRRGSGQEAKRRQSSEESSSHGDVPWSWGPPRPLRAGSATGVPQQVREVLAPLLVYDCRHCLLYTSDAADERSSVDLGGRRIIKQKNR